MEHDALAITKAKISLTQAINVADQHVHGKASQAEYENSKLGWVYDVEVVSGAKVFDVKVDGAKGTVISSAAYVPFARPVVRLDSDPTTQQLSGQSGLFLQRCHPNGAGFHHP